MANIAEPLRRLHAHGVALQYLRRATELAPDKFNVWANLGSLYAAMEMKTEAVAALRKALSLAPEDKRSEIGDFLKAVMALAPLPKPGAALLIEGRIDEAITELVKESKKEPSTATVWQNLACAYLRKGQDESARAALKRLHELEPDNAFAWLNFMRLASKRGDLSEAEKWCDRYAAVPGLVGRSKAFRAHVLEENGRLQDAKKLLLSAMKDHPDEPDIFATYGDLAMKHRMPEQAAEAYRRAVHIIKGTSNNDDFVVGSTTPAARRSFPLLIWRGCVSAFCGRCPVQGPSVGLLRYAAATIRSSVTSRRML